MAKKSESAERRARAAQLQEEHRRAERRRSLLIIGSCIGLAIVIVGVAAVALVNEQRNRDQVAAAAKGAIDGVQEFDDLSRNHVEKAVDYPQTPSVGGDHNPVWTNCGVYTEPVDATQATHALEHGAVWIGYDPALPNDEVDTLTTLAKANDYVILSPVEGIPAAVTLSAWGKQLPLDRADDPRLEAFVQKYQQGPQTPEPGAPCTGGSMS